jgi:alkylhydroperoxidase family enzyme
VTAAPRVPPIPPRQWPPKMKAALAALVPPDPRHPLPRRDPGRPQGLNILGTLAHHPDLAQAFHAFNGHVLFATTLTPRQRELLVLRVAGRRGADYEWAQHVVQATDAGMTADEIVRVLDDPDTGGWSPLERALLHAADELVDEARIADATWEALAAELGHRQIMDVIFTVGAYDVLAMLIRSFGIPLDDDLAGMPMPGHAPAAPVPPAERK